MVTDGTSIIFSPFYDKGEDLAFNLKTGIYSFDLSGKQNWFVQTNPLSHGSIKNGLLYMVEGDIQLVERTREGTGKDGKPYTFKYRLMTILSSRLTARRVSDGQVVWVSSPLPSGAGVQAPVLSNGLVIVATYQDVKAYNQASGVNVWSRPLVNASIAFEPQVGLMVYSRYRTSMAAAEGSNTLIVTAGDGLYGLSITTGEQKWGVVNGSADWARLFPNISKRLFNPVIVGKKLYVIDGYDPAYSSPSGKLYILESN